MVFRMELNFSKIEKILGVKFNVTSTNGYILPPGLYEFSVPNLMLKS